MDEKKKLHGGQKTEDEAEPNTQVDKQDKKGSKKKGKGKKGKKRKGRGKKSSRETSEEDKTVLKKFLDSLRGSRRLMVRTFYFILFQSVSSASLLSLPSNCCTKATV